MLTMRPLDEHVPIQQQLGATASPAVLINIFTVAPLDTSTNLAGGSTPKTSSTKSAAGGSTAPFIAAAARRYWPPAASCGPGSTPVACRPARRSRRRRGTSRPGG